MVVIVVAESRAAKAVLLCRDPDNTDTAWTKRVYKSQQGFAGDAVKTHNSRPKERTLENSPS